MSESRASFDQEFATLAGFQPMSWQMRLYRDEFAQGELPDAIDIPTGLGKTAVMALWLIALARGVRLPRRLVYVVDRRAVVDQATDFAEQLRANLNAAELADLKSGLALNDASLRISTLRGQHVDNREWLEDPSAAAIIVGTVDMIGSRLLFEGYGVTRKMRPYNAGLLGADALIVLDEAHLVPPFEKLLETIEKSASTFGAGDLRDRKRIPAFKLLSLSATGRYSRGAVFRLEERDSKNDGIALRRLQAKKSASLLSIGSDALDEMLADQAWDLAKKGTRPVRCLVYCDRRETAEKVIASLRLKSKGTGTQAELLVGARRVFEREDAARRLKELGFIAGNETPRECPVFVVATSAGEVGIDLDADCMACDLVAWERMVQRLGRVNRRGDGNADVVIVDAGEPQLKKKGNPTPEESDAIRRHHAVLALLRQLPRKGDRFDVSPAALRALKMRVGKNDDMRRLVETATTRPPLRPALTRPLVDAWSMTSLEEHTGRPEVAPWLRGWVEEEPMTTVVWRMQLPTLANGRAMSRKDVEAFFEAAPPHASEILETETWRVAEWLIARSELLRTVNVAHDDSAKGEPLRGNEAMAFVLSGASDLRKILYASEVEALDKEDVMRLFRNQTLIVDARVRGLSSPDGMLDQRSETFPRTADDGGTWIEDENGPIVRFRVRVQAPDAPPPSGDWRERLRLVRDRNADEEPVQWLVVEKLRHYGSTEEDRSAGWWQTLEEHESWTEQAALEIAKRLQLDAECTEILACAARLHDEGKRAKRWQRAFNALPDATYAKTLGGFNRALLGGYRHEFGSIPYVVRDQQFRKLTPPAQELVLHLVAAHHGYARPLIPTQGCEDAPPSALQERAREVALRFAALQKRWGPWGLAWWEALLRAADQQASRKNDERAKTEERESA